RSLYLTPLRQIDYLSKKGMDEEEVFNWIEMDLRENGYCDDLDIKKIIVQFSKNAAAILTRLENLFAELTYPPGYVKLGWFYQNSKHEFFDRKKAIYFFEKALESIPKQPNPETSYLQTLSDSDAYEDLAILYLDEGQPIDALNAMQKAFEWDLNRRTAIRLLFLARVYSTLGDFGEAEKHLQTILKLQGDQTPGFAKIADTYIELAQISRICGRYQQAHAYLDVAREAAKKTYGPESSLLDKAEKVFQALLVSERLASRTKLSSLGKASIIPSYCITLVKRLIAQPLFVNRDGVTEKRKIISLKSNDESRICEIFNNNTRGFIDSHSWLRITSFPPNRLIRNAKGKEIKEGLILDCSDKKELCSLATLETSYNQIFKNMTTGWERATIDENPYIMYKQKSDEFDLFIKEDNMLEEDSLIRLIARRFSIESSIKCDSLWLHQNGGYCSGKLYLWIKKSDVEKVIDIFGFKF
ncbi:MAG: hypothetical protein JWO53_786, partial [Chlamydiia bacterium]|nr:hypothetical protein [Chlamydiia bacterium]